MQPTFFATPADFRSWLLRHHDSMRELLVGFYKKASGRPSITWPESVDEALCFGWIDGVRRGIDADSYTIRFTPRRKGSTWSVVNIRRAKELIREGRMRAAGLAAFKAVLLEGIEVVFIVIAVGTARQQTLYAGLGALAALVLVILIGLLVHRPLAKIPENALKFVVGLMLTSFGIFWTGEGLGAAWPGEDLALVVIFAIVSAASMGIVRWLRGTRPRPTGDPVR